MSTPTAKRIRVAAGVLFRSGRLLITQRPVEKHLGGLWEFPGGKVEPDETYEDCLVRELREELGIEVRPGATLAAVEHAYPEKTVCIHFLRCSLIQGEPQCLDCQDLAWVEREALDQYVFPPADTGLLHRLRSEPDLWSE